MLPVAPAVIAHVIYPLDVNFRSATLRGVVGAAGINFFLLLIVAVVLAPHTVAVLLRNIVR